MNQLRIFAGKPCYTKWMEQNRRGLAKARRGPRRRHHLRRFARAIAFGLCVELVILGTSSHAQQSSVSAWDAADFRSWSFIPYWTTLPQVQSFAADRVYDHISDVVYHSGVQPRADGSLFTGSTAASHLAALKNHQAQFGFRYHLDMYDAVRNSGESAANAVERVWNAITSNPTTRATFINNVENVLAANNMTGFNLDWERPNTATEWGNYTQLAREMQAAFPEHWEVSVDDYGFADTRWDDSPLFDARVYDQIGIMGYHYPANNGTSLDQQSFADGKEALTGQGAEKAFKDSQIIIGMGTWGAAGPATVTLKNIVGVNPNLPPDASSFTGTVRGIDGVTYTDTWDIVSRYEVRDNVELALDRGMAGVMWWSLMHDATNDLSLARVAQHYAMFKRSVPDLNLDGKVSAADANKLADEIGVATLRTGTHTPDRFENFYINGNWEKGDRDGNGYVNQQDADWLAGRFAALNVALPDRLPYTGTFERLQDGRGLEGRWQAVRSAQGALPETGNYTQHSAGFLSFSGNGAGANLHSNSAVTLRNQSAGEAADAVNAATRAMRVELSEPIEMAANEDTYVTFLVRQNTGALTLSQFESPSRTLALEFLDATGENQFDFAFHGQQQEYAIRSEANAGGEDVVGVGFDSDTTYLFVGKISGNGGGANTIHVSLFANGSTVGRFIEPDFEWMIAGQSFASFNPTLTQLQFTSSHEASYTVSNVWIGGAHDFFVPAPADFGDFNGDGSIDAADFLVWRNGVGENFSYAHYDVWRRHFGRTIQLGAGGHFAPGDSLGANYAVPEPTTAVLLVGSAAIGWLVRTRSSRGAQENVARRSETR
jgi:hypothetical protein